MVVIDVDGLPVIFPYERLYPEQREYMLKLKQALDCKGHAVLEMPSGTGKTITLLALITAHISNRPDAAGRKFVYCTRTVEEMQKVMGEMKLLTATREHETKQMNKLVTVGLASRRHLCVHERVSRVDGESIDSACRSLTAPWVREAAKHTIDVSGNVSAVEVCKYFENFDSEDLLDPKVAAVVLEYLSPETVIVFDECHNVDNVAMESMSVDLTASMLDAAQQNITALSSAVVARRRQEHARLEREYARITDGLSLSAILRERAGSHANEDDAFRVGVLPEDVLREAVPQSIRKAEAFISLLRKLTDFLKQKSRSNVVTQESPGPFLCSMAEACRVEDFKAFQVLYERLILLMRTLELSSWQEFRSLMRVGDFATILATYRREGFVVLFEPFNDVTGERAPVLRLVNCDPGLAFRWLMAKFDTIIMTSGTLSPLEFYPRLLNFRAAVSQSFNMSMDRRCVFPLILTRGADQIALSSRYNDRQSDDIPRNYGMSLLEFASVVPDGIVVFFVSYVFMQQVMHYWHDESDILQRLRKKKLVFVETQDPIESSLAIQNYRTACDCGRGAVLLSVARGRAAEGIDFDHHYGRAVILFGVPFQYTESRILKAKLAWLSEHHGIKEDDFLIFDAMRQAAQCAGRVIRNKNDYGIVVFADRRFMKVKLRSKLPKWIAQFISANSLDLDVGTAVSHARQFLLSIAQPIDDSQFIAQNMSSFLD